MATLVLQPVHSMEVRQALGGRSLAGPQQTAVRVLLDRIAGRTGPGRASGPSRPPFRHLARNERLFERARAAFQSSCRRLPGWLPPPALQRVPRSFKGDNDMLVDRLIAASARKEVATDLLVVSLQRMQLAKGLLASHHRLSVRLLATWEPAAACCSCLEPQLHDAS